VPVSALAKTLARSAGDRPDLGEKIAYAA